MWPKHPVRPMLFCTGDMVCYAMGRTDRGYLKRSAENKRLFRPKRDKVTEESCITIMSMT